MSEYQLITINGRGAHDDTSHAHSCCQRCSGDWFVGFGLLPVSVSAHVFRRVCSMGHELGIFVPAGFLRLRNQLRRFQLLPHQQLRRKLRHQLFGQLHGL